jgi:predicted Zn-dependent protease
MFQKTPIRRSMETKRMIKNFSLMIATMLFASSAFAIFEEETNLQMRVNEHGQMTNLTTQEVIQIKGETDFELLLKAPHLINLNGRIPVLFVPVQPGLSQVKLNPPTFKEAVGDTAQIEIGKIVSNLMVGIQDIQTEIRRKNLDRAFEKLEQIEKQYPRVTYLEFIKGSIYLLQGNKSQARKAVERGLEAHPDYKEGQEFLKSLGGEVKGDK